MKIKEFLKENLRGKIDLDKTDDVSNAIKEISKWVHSGDEHRIKIFEIGEKNNIHITPVHFYQPIHPNLVSRILKFYLEMAQSR